MASYLYIHVPFCTKKCLYCDFYSIPIDTRLAARYVSALCSEIASIARLVQKLKTIYIGGGTPTLLCDGMLQDIVNTVREYGNIDKDAEITIEGNPESLNQSKVDEILSAGISRISIGVQSFIDDELKILGRSHTAFKALDAINIIKSAGFQNISIDLIYGIPEKAGSNISSERYFKSWEFSLLKTVELDPEHISIYELTPEKDTPLYNEIMAKRILMPDEHVVTQIYYMTKEILEKQGYIHYEISNFAKPGYECIHNLNYWDGDCYLGVGAGAHSFVDGVRSSNVRDVNYYIKAVENGNNPIVERIELNAQDRIKELIFLGLRKTKGIYINKIPEESQKRMKTVLNDLIEFGLVELNKHHLRLTSKGLMLSSEIMTRLLRVV